MAAGSAILAAALQAANRSHADYHATIGSNMAGTDSIQFQDLIPSVSVRENERITGIIRGSNPNIIIWYHARRSSSAPVTPAGNPR